MTDLTRTERAERLVTPRLLGVVSGAFAFYLGFGMTTPLLAPFVHQALGDGDLVVGVVVGLVGVAAIGVRPLLVKRLITWGAVRVIILALVVGAAASSCYGLTTNSAQLGALRLLAGASMAAITVAALTMVTDAAPPARRGEAISYFTVAPYLAMGFGPVIGETVRDLTGMRPALMLSGAVIILGVIPMLFIDNLRRPLLAHEQGQSAFHRKAIVPGVVLSLGLIGAFALMAFLPLFALQLGSRSSAWIFLEYGLIVLVMRTAGARLPDRLGAGRAAVSATILIAVGLVTMTAAPEVALIYLGVLPFSIGIALQYPGLMALTLARVGPAERPRAISTFTMFIDVSQGFGGLLLGSVASIGGYRAVYGVSAGCAVIAFAILLGWSRTQRHMPLADQALQP